MSALVAAALFAQLVVVGDDPAVCRARKAHRSATAEPTGELTVRELLERKAEKDCVRFVVPAHLLSRRAGSLAAVGITLHDEKVIRVEGPPAPPSPDRVTDEELDRGIQCKSPGHCVIARALLDRLLADTTTLATAARIVPSIHDGRADGFKLYAMRPGSLWTRLGFENGDTVETINGMDLSSPEKALEIYSKLRTTTEIAVGIVRRGEPLTLHFEIR